MPLIPSAHAFRKPADECFFEGSDGSFGHRGVTPRNHFVDIEVVQLLFEFALELAKKPLVVCRDP